MGSVDECESETYHNRLIWFDENINNEYNKMFFNKLKNNFPNLKGFQSLDQGFVNFYQNSEFLSK